MTRSPLSCAAPAPGRRLSQALRRIPRQATVRQRRIKEILSRVETPGRSSRKKGGADHGHPLLPRLRIPTTPAIARLSKARCVISCTPSFPAIFGPTDQSPLRRQDRRTLRALPPTPQPTSQWGRFSGRESRSTIRRPGTNASRTPDLVPVVLDLVAAQDIDEAKAKGLRSQNPPHQNRPPLSSGL